jgi:hypothetical protein
MSDRQLIADLLSALEYHTEQTRPIEFSRVAIEAAREYLRKPAQQQEPVCDKDPRGCWSVRCQLGKVCKNTSPQRKPWVGLTWDDMPDSSCDDPAFLAGAQWANSKLKEKNA